MKKVLVYSIKPEHMLNILNGNKTIEIRKRDLPQWAKDKLDRGEIVQGYGYCTKGKPYLEPRECNGEFVWNIHNDFIYHTDLNGKVVFKFQVSGVSRFDYDKRINHYTYGNMQVDNMTKFLKNVCITENDIWNYGSNSGFKPLYAHHFTNIQPIKPMELGEFYRMIDGLDEDGGFLLNTLKDGECVSIPQLKQKYLIKQPPQSFMTAWVMEVVE